MGFRGERFQGAEAAAHRECPLLCGHQVRDLYPFGRGLRDFGAPSWQPPRVRTFPYLGKCHGAFVASSTVSSTYLQPRISRPVFVEADDLPTGENGAIDWLHQEGVDIYWSVHGARWHLPRDRRVAHCSGESLPAGALPCDCKKRPLLFGSGQGCQR